MSARSISSFDYNLLELYRQHRDEIDAITDPTSLFILAFANQVGRVDIDILAKEVGLSLVTFRTKITPLLRGQFMVDNRGILGVTAAGKRLLTDLGFFVPPPVGPSEPPKKPEPPPPNGFNPVLLVGVAGAVGLLVVTAIVLVFALWVLWPRPPIIPTLVPAFVPPPTVVPVPPTFVPPPTATNTPTFTPTATNTPTFTPTATNTPTFTPTATNTPTFTPTPSCAYLNITKREPRDGQVFSGGSMVFEWWTDYPLKPGESFEVIIRLENYPRPWIGVGVPNSSGGWKMPITISMPPGRYEWTVLVKASDGSYRTCVVGPYSFVLVEKSPREPDIPSEPPCHYPSYCPP